MKTRLLITLLFFAFFSATAQTTYNLNWFAGIGSNADLTIETGDTVIWTWTSTNHTVENIPGSSVETFNSGFMADTGSTYSYTFTAIGANDYFCGVHGAASMSGTITVTENLGIDENQVQLFKIISNPSRNELILELPQTISDGQLNIHDMMGKRVYSQNFKDIPTLNINISSLNLGLYLITVKSNNASHTKRFIKK